MFDQLLITGIFAWLLFSLIFSEWSAVWIFACAMLAVYFLGLVDTAEQIVARLPTTLDKSDAFFTNADKILRESELPEFSKDAPQ